MCLQSLEWNLSSSSNTSLLGGSKDEMRSIGLVAGPWIMLGYETTPAHASLFRIVCSWDIEVIQMREMFFSTFHSFLIYTGSTNRPLHQHKCHRRNGCGTKDSVARTICSLERED
jgi:hypothetical protein